MRLQDAEGPPMRCALTGATSQCFLLHRCGNASDYIKPNTAKDILHFNGTLTQETGNNLEHNLLCHESYRLKADFVFFSVSTCTQDLAVLKDKMKMQMHTVKLLTDIQIFF